MNTLQLPNAEFLPYVCQLVAQGHRVSIRAKGNSMRPFLESGRDIAILSRSDDFGVGDVVLGEIEKGHFVLHRIDSIRLPDGTCLYRGERCDNPEARVTLRGDGNPFGTEHCLLQDLRAVARQFVRKGKTWDTDSRVWRIYSHAWMRLLPVRRYLLAIYRLLWLGQWPRRFCRKSMTGK